MRIEPPPSLACAIGNMPAATAAAGAAARAAGRALGVPRVARDAVAGVLGRRDHAEGGRVGAPAQHEAGAPRARPRRARSPRSARSGAPSRAVRHRPAGDGREVLDRDRHAEEGRLLAGLQAAVGLRRRRHAPASSLRQVTAFSCGLRSSTTARHGVEQLDGGELAPAEGGGELEGGRCGSERGHGATLPG